ALVRYAHRLFWITGLSIAMLTAFAIDAFADRSEPKQRFWISLALVATLAAGLFTFTPGGIHRIEIVTLAIVIIAYGVAMAPSLRVPAAWIAAAAVLVNIVAVPLR